MYSFVLKERGGDLYIRVLREKKKVIRDKNVRVSKTPNNTIFYSLFKRHTRSKYDIGAAIYSNQMINNTYAERPEATNNAAFSNPLYAKCDYDDEENDEKH